MAAYDAIAPDNSGAGQFIPGSPRVPAPPVFPGTRGAIRGRTAGPVRPLPSYLKTTSPPPALMARRVASSGGLRLCSASAASTAFVRSS